MRFRSTFLVQIRKHMPLHDMKISAGELAQFAVIFGFFSAIVTQMSVNGRFVFVKLAAIGTHELTRTVLVYRSKVTNSRDT